MNKNFQGSVSLTRITRINKYSQLLVWKKSAAAGIQETTAAWIKEPLADCEVGGRGVSIYQGWQAAGEQRVGRSASSPDTPSCGWPSPAAGTWGHSTCTKTVASSHSHRTAGAHNHSTWLAEYLWYKIVPVPGICFTHFGFDLQYRLPNYLPDSLILF